jgi:hypothetical protein
MRHALGQDRTRVTVEVVASPDYDLNGRYKSGVAGFETAVAN